jgi:hypothetical protein
VQSSRRRTDSNGLNVPADKGSEPLLELSGLGTCGQPTGSENLGYGLDLFLPDRRLEAWDL